jgi:N-acetylglucosaminyl-diphospho-decaprenol L-rhamnosyltransferase
MDLSIIIVNWKSAAYCADCLTSIYASPPGVTFEIVVIDNASYDGCDRMLLQRFPKVKFIQSATNGGFAGANNTAFSHSSGSTVCFLNPDTVIRGTALQTLYYALHSIVDAGAVGALLLNGDGSLQTSCVLPFPTILNQTLDIEWVRRRFPRAALFGAAAIFTQAKVPQKVEAISGACIMIHRTLFNEIGMFSRDYFMYSEDIDLCRKIEISGQKVYLINAAEIIHFGGGSAKEQKSRLFSALLIRESNFRLLCKFRGRGYALLYRSSLAAAAGVRIAGLLLSLIPAIVIGRVHCTIEITVRWWNLLLWALGIKRLPYPVAKGTIRT